MTPEQLRDLAEMIVKEIGLAKWAVALLLIISSAFGAYFGAYLKRMGENRALREEFKEIKRQLRETTQITEDVKRTIGGQGWLDQQRWARREERIVQLVISLERVHRLGKILPELLEIHKRDGKITEQAFNDDFVKSHLLALDESVAQLMSAMSVGRIYLSDNILGPINVMIEKYKDGKAVKATPETAVEYLCFYAQWCDSAKSVLDSVIFDSRKHLAKLEEASPA